MESLPQSYLQSFPKEILEETISKMTPKTMGMFARISKENEKIINDFCAKILTRHFPHIDPTKLDQERKLLYCCVAVSLATENPDFAVLDRFIDEQCKKRGVRNLFNKISGNMLGDVSLEMYLSDSSRTISISDNNWKNSRSLFIKEKAKKMSLKDDYARTEARIICYDIFCEYLSPLMRCRNLELAFDNGLECVTLIPDSVCETVEELNISFGYQNSGMLFSLLSRFINLRKLVITNGFSVFVDRTIMKMTKLQELVIHSDGVYLPPNLNELPELKTISLDEEEGNVRKILYMMDIEKIDEVNQFYYVATIRRKND